MTILVSGASGVVGYGILKTLKDHNRIGTTIYDYSVAPAFCEAVEKILPTTDYYYFDNLYEIISRHKVDMIIPSIECDMFKWNHYRDILAVHAFPMLNDSSLIDLCFDKWLFYQQLVKHNPKYAIPTSLTAINFPMLLKPRRGFGSKGIVWVYNERELEFYSEKIGLELMVQPIIGTEEEEYTVSGFFGYDSELLDFFPLKRKLVNGFTGEAIVEDRNFGDILSELAETFHPVGPTNFQFRFDGDQAKLLEINPRISSATSIRAAFGYNEAQMCVDYFLHGETPNRKDKLIGRRAIRYSEDYII